MKDSVKKHYLASISSSGVNWGGGSSCEPLESLALGQVPSGWASAIVRLVRFPVPGQPRN
ncbi:hypothetical protein GGD56_000712 [Rhizobium mongolense]|uniref:Uncharacterized protein n=2 Tax=Rhizobium mongolense TaxID=57676 RepID=A0ABR6IGA3_9HYPH|nr:hypothetical protein [Rhizobium mongolense]TVZ74108.1 hypothetical protein BCL32_2422 [Rhizobium mongolense USDA 1844]